VKKKIIPYENPDACPNCLSVRISRMPKQSPTARVCVNCDHSWDLNVYDVPPDCVLVELPGGGIGVMQDGNIPTHGYTNRRQAEMFAWASYGMMGAPPASAGRWEASAKRARDAWLAQREESLEGLRAQMALMDIVFTAAAHVDNNCQLYVGTQYVGSVDEATRDAINKTRSDAAKLKP
jgi:hypothetical protein